MSEEQEPTTPPGEDVIRLRGILEVSENGGPFEPLGENLVLLNLRSSIASWLAGTPLDQATLIPHTLVVGFDTSLPSLGDSELKKPYLVSQHDLTPVKIELQATPTATVTGSEVKVVYQFVLPPDMMVYDPTSAAQGDTTEFTIREWGMLNSAEALVNRRVKSYIKSAGTTSTIRWTIFV